MLNYLVKKGHDEETISSVMARLEQSLLIGDEAFTREWIESKLRSKLSGPAKIKNELLIRGISKDLAESLLYEIYPHELELSVARRAAAGYLKRLESNSVKDIKRVYTNLLSRGFSLEVIKEVLRDGLKLDEPLD